MNNSLNNHILKALPEQEYQRLKSYLVPIQLSLNEILVRPDRKNKMLYFPTQGIVSLMSVMQDGYTTQVGVVGREGMVGTLQFLGEAPSNCQYIVRVQGWAMAIEQEVLQREFHQVKMLQKLLLGYALKLFNQVSQCAACNSHHSVRQRIARWLLMLDDRCDEDILLMTQQLFSQMLGVRRTGITEVAKKLQQQKIINYHRGKIEIIDREALEMVACECYQLLKDRS